jgi:hypothetical protein
MAECWEESDVDDFRVDIGAEEEEGREEGG